MNNEESRPDHATSLEQGIHRVSTLYELSSILTGGPSFEQEIDQFLYAFSRVTNASSIVLVSFPSVLLSSNPDIGCIGISRRLREQMTFDMSFVNELRSTGNGYIAKSPFAETEDIENSWLVSHNENVLGVLTLCKKSPLTQYEHQLVNELLRHIRVALYNRRLFRQREEADRLINESIRRDRDLQVKANRGKTRFLAVMSHELRTPMNGVIGMASIMLDEPLLDRQREQLEIIIESATSLVDIVGNVLELDSIESGLAKLRPRVFSLPELANHVAALGKSLINTDRVSIVTEVDPSLATPFSADETRLRQILTNFVSNAAKFTEDGHITIRMVPEHRAHDIVSMRCSVTDTGPGISPADLESIFAPYTQADSLAHQNKQGAGLGLTIAKQLVELLGGEIGAHSDEGTGTTFWFTAPLKVADVNPKDDSHKPTAPAVLADVPAQMHVLLAEDNKINQKIASVMLEKCGWQVDSVEDGLRALELYRAEASRYDLILMDCQMPKMDGIEAARAIRTWEAGQENARSVPIIAITANALEEDRQKCLECGMNGFLTKPFKRDALIQSIKEVLAHSNDVR